MDSIDFAQPQSLLFVSSNRPGLQDKAAHIHRLIFAGKVLAHIIPVDFQLKGRHILIPGIEGDILQNLQVLIAVQPLRAPISSLVSLAVQAASAMA